jgi:hypothetical protein
MRGSWSLRLRGEDKESLSTEEETRGSRVYAFGARTTPNSLIEEEARSRDEGFWGLRLRGKDKKSLSIEEETRGSGVYAFGARTKRVHPLRKRREVVESTPSGRAQKELSTEEETRCSGV